MTKNNETIMIEGDFTIIPTIGSRKRYDASRLVAVPPRRPMRRIYPGELSARLDHTWMRPLDDYDLDDIKVLREAIEHLEQRYAILEQRQDGEALTEQQAATSEALTAMLQTLAGYGDSLDAILGMYAALKEAQSQRNEAFDELERAAGIRDKLVRERHKMLRLVTQSFHYLEHVEKETPSDRNQRQLFLIKELSPMMIKEDDIPF